MPGNYLLLDGRVQVFQCPEVAPKVMMWTSAEQKQCCGAKDRQTGVQYMQACSIRRCEGSCPVCYSPTSPRCRPIWVRDLYKNPVVGLDNADEPTFYAGSSHIGRQSIFHSPKEVTLNA